VNAATPINLPFRRLAKEVHDVAGSLIRRQERDDDLPGAAALGLGGELQESLQVGKLFDLGGQDGGFRDETMPETFAPRMSPQDYASQSQMIHDLHGLSH